MERDDFNRKKLKSERDKIAGALNAIKFKSTENWTRWRSQIFVKSVRVEKRRNSLSVLPLFTVVLLAVSIGFLAFNFYISSF